MSRLQGSDARLSGTYPLHDYPTSRPLATSLSTQLAGADSDAAVWRLFQLAVAFSVDLVLTPRQHLLRRDVAGGTVQADLRSCPRCVVLLDATNYRVPSEEPAGGLSTTADIHARRCRLSMAAFSSGVKCFRSFLIRSLRYPNGTTPSPFPTEAGQLHYAHFRQLAGRSLAQRNEAVCRINANNSERPTNNP